MVTLKDISKDTGVSVTQVSRALGGHTDVNAETRTKVEAAAVRLGYRPNTFARSLRTGRSGIVAMVVDGSISSTEHELTLEAVMGISAQISKQDMKFVLHVTQPSEDPTEVHEQLFSGGAIDGFIITNPTVDDPRIGRLMEQGIPHVVHGRDPTRDHPHVDIDNTRAIKEMTAYLLARGHRQIAFLNGPQERVFAKSRATGFRLAFEQAGFSTEHLQLSHGVMTVDRGLTATKSLMEGPHRPTAIIAGNTMLARGVYRAAAELGLHIPDDLSVLAHDDGLSAYPVSGFSPQVSGTRSFMTDAWAMLADLLQTAIDDGPSAVKSRKLHATFIENGSVRDLRPATA